MSASRQQRPLFPRDYTRKAKDKTFFHIGSTQTSINTIILGVSQVLFLSLVVLLVCQTREVGTIGESTLNLLIGSSSRRSHHWWIFCNIVVRIMIPSGLGLLSRILESLIKVGCPSRFKSFLSDFNTYRKPLLLWSF